MSRFARAMGLKKEVLSRKPSAFEPTKRPVFSGGSRRHVPRSSDESGFLPADGFVPEYESVADERAELALLLQYQARRVLLEVNKLAGDDNTNLDSDEAFDPNRDYVRDLRRRQLVFCEDSGWEPVGGWPESSGAAGGELSRDPLDVKHTIDRLLRASQQQADDAAAAEDEWGHLLWNGNSSSATPGGASSSFVHNAPVGSGLRQRDSQLMIGGPDELEDRALVAVAAPDELAVERYEESSLEVRPSGAAGTIQVPRPNLVATAVPQRGVFAAPPITGTGPPSLMEMSTVDRLKADGSLDPSDRVGVTPHQLLSLAEAMDAISSTLEPVDPEKHPPSELAISGFESDCDSDTDDANFELAKKGQFVPAAGGKQSLSTMLTYKTQFRRLYEPLMSKCKLSRKRANVSVTSLDIFYRTLRICGDFPQSRHQYFSQVKGHIEMTHALKPEVSKAYDKYFGRLLSMRKRGHQQKGLRASDMVHIANKLGSSDKLRNDVVMQFEHEGQTVKITAELAFRFIIGCWWAFLRPDCSGHTARELLPGGNGAVKYRIFSSKTDQSGDVVAETVLECNCRSIPKTPICICPVHCISCSDWECMQRTMKLHAANKKKKVAEKLAAKAQEDQEDLPEDDKEGESAARPSEPKWAAAIWRILELVGIDNPRVGGNTKRGFLGRHSFGPYSVRIGGCQSARDAGTPEDFIQSLGRWVSEKTKQHYKGLACCMPDSIRIPWPVRVGILFSNDTNYNSEADWAHQLNLGGGPAGGGAVDDDGLM